MNQTQNKTDAKNAQGKQAALPYTAFTDQPERLYCPGYDCTDRGVRADNGTLVCMHPIMPVGALRNGDDDTVRMEIAFNADGHWETHAFPRQKLASAAGILELADLGVAVTNENARALSAYLTKLFHLNDTVLPTRTSLNRFGWLSPYSDEFAPYCADIVMDPDPAYRERARAVRIQGSEKDWAAAVRPVAEKNLIARLALDASFASVLLPILQLQPFFVHIWGRTGLGKTVLLQPPASVWGDPRPGRMLGTFNATAVGLESTAAFLHHLPVCIDELQILNAMGRENFQQTIYQLCSGTGRIRGAKDGGFRKQNTWCNVFITTGERPLNSEFSGGGALNRSIELELTEPVTEDFAALVGAIQRHYGAAGWYYVDLVKSKRKYVQEFYDRHLRGLIAEGVTGKQASAMAALLTADDFSGPGLMDPANTRPPISYKTAASLLLKEADVCREAQAVNYLFDMIAANPAKFPKTTGVYEPNEVWGKPMGDKVAVIGSIFDKIMRDGGYDPKAVLSHAAREGLLETGSNDHYKKNIRIGKQVVRCVVMKNPTDTSAATPENVTML